MEAFLLLAGLPPSSSPFRTPFSILVIAQAGPVTSEGSSGLFLSEGGW